MPREFISEKRVPTSSKGGGRSWSAVDRQLVGQVTNWSGAIDGELQLTGPSLEVGRTYAYGWNRHHLMMNYLSVWYCVIHNVYICQGSERTTLMPRPPNRWSDGDKRKKQVRNFFSIPAPNGFLSFEAMINKVITWTRKKELTWKSSMCKQKQRRERQVKSRKKNLRLRVNNKQTKKQTKEQFWTFFIVCYCMWVFASAVQILQSAHILAIENINTAFDLWSYWIVFISLFTYTFFFYKNTFYKNIQAEIPEKLRTW